MGLGFKRKYREKKKEFENLTLKWLRPHIKLMMHPTKTVDYKAVPVIINNFNRLTMLRRLIDSLETRGYHNIYIIDNGSSYPPLIEWYSSCKYQVYMLNSNVGHLSLWKTGIYKQFEGSYYAYTDADLEINPDCPDDFMEKFISLLRKFPKALKVGFSLDIDDLPDCFSHKQEVIAHESQFWNNEIAPGIFQAPIDTTFAVYKPYFMGELVDLNNVYLRTGKPYSAKHLPWYVDTAHRSEEEEYYISHIKTLTHWSQKEAEK